MVEIIMTRKLCCEEIERLFSNKSNGYSEITQNNCPNDQKETVKQLNALGIRIVKEPESNIHNYMFIRGNDCLEIAISSLANKQVVDLVEPEFKLK